LKSAHAAGHQTNDGQWGEHAIQVAAYLFDFRGVIAGVSVVQLKGP
jgi:hypothetical protein